MDTGGDVADRDAGELAPRGRVGDAEGAVVDGAERVAGAGRGGGAVVNVPLTRSLSYVLREQLAKEPLRLSVGEVVSVPDANHVRVSMQGAEVTLPRLTSYGSPEAGEPAYIVAGALYTMVLGTVGGVPPAAGSRGRRVRPGRRVRGADGFDRRARSGGRDGRAGHDGRRREG